jgi:hypothetical protein
MEFGLVFADVDLLAWVPLFFFAATLIFIGFDLLAEWLVSGQGGGGTPSLRLKAHAETVLLKCLHLNNPPPPLMCTLPPFFSPLRRGR